MDTQSFCNISNQDFYTNYECDARRESDAVTKRLPMQLKPSYSSAGLPSAPIGSAWGSSGGGGTQDRDPYGPQYPAHPLGLISSSPLPQQAANFCEEKSKGLQTMPRSEAWRRFLAYECCIQICIARLSEREASFFLNGGMRELRSGLGISGLLFSPPSSRADPSPRPYDNNINNDLSSKTAGLFHWTVKDSNIKAGTQSSTHHVELIQWDDSEELCTQTEHAAPLPDARSLLPQLKAHQHGRRALDFDAACDQEASIPPHHGAAARETSSTIGTNGPYLAIRLRDNNPSGCSNGNKIKGGSIIRISYNGKSSSFSIQGSASSSSSSSSSSSPPLVIGVGAIQTREDPAGCPDVGSVVIEVSSLVGVVGRGSAGLMSLIQLAEEEGATVMEEEDVQVSGSGSGKKAGKEVNNNNLGTWIFGRSKEKSQQHPPPSSSSSTPNQHVAQSSQQQHPIFQAEIRSGNSKLGSVDLEVGLFDSKESAKAFSWSSAAYKTFPSSPSPAPLTQNESAQRKEAPSRNLKPQSRHNGPLTFDLNGVMETLFQSAWQASGCSSTSLCLSGPWQWLFTMFVEQYRVSKAWHALIHLEKILKADHVSSSPHFYDVLSRLLMNLLEMEGKSTLLPYEADFFAGLKARVEGILQVTLESYHLYLLCSNEELGLLFSSSMDQVDMIRASGQGLGFPERLRDERFLPIKGALETYKLLRGSIEREGGGGGGGGVRRDNCTWLEKRLGISAELRWEELLKTRGAILGLDLNAMISGLLKVARARQGSRPVVAKEATTPLSAQKPPIPQSPLAQGLANKRQNASASKHSAHPSPSPHKHAVTSAHTSDQIFSALASLGYGVSGDVYFDSLLQDRLESTDLRSLGVSFSHHLAAEHRDRMLEVLRAVFVVQPPFSYSKPALDLYVGLADLHSYVQDKIGLSGGMACLLSLFQPHVNYWLKETEEKLTELTRDEARRSPLPNTLYPILPLASSLAATVPSGLFDVLSVHESLLPSAVRAIEASWNEIQKYESVLASWPAFCLDLESSLSRVMSSILEALKSRPAFDFNAPLSPAHLAQVNDAQSTTISSQDADSLNTLKLLMVFASLIETTLVNWSSKAGTDQANNIASIVGSHLSQVSQAVQNVYTEAISSCVKNLNVLLDKATSRSLSTVISGYPPLTPPSPDMFHSPLRQSLNSGLTQSLVHTSLSQLIESIRRSLSSFKSKLEPMVYIAVVRALWDSFGHQVMCCINEQRGGTSQAAEEMMRSRERAGCAMNVLSEFFCSHLHGLPFEGDKEKLLSFPKRVLEVEQMMNQRAKDRIGDVVNFSPF